MVDGHAGKGSRYRPVNQKKYDEGWEAAFGKKTKKKDKKKNETRTRNTDCENNKR